MDYADGNLDFNLWVNRGRPDLEGKSTEGNEILLFWGLDTQVVHPDMLGY